MSLPKQIPKQILEPTRIDFCPIPSNTDTVSVVKVAEDVYGVLVWTFGNGDTIVRLEESHWYLPAGGYTAEGVYSG